jgi:hypothetical protein
MGFEPTIPMFEWAKIFIGINFIIINIGWSDMKTIYIYIYIYIPLCVGGGSPIITKIEAVTKDSMSAYWKRLRGQNLWTKYVSDMKTV